jgi:hypothetical protein
MLGMRVAVSAICFLAAASACASTGSNTPSFAATPEREYPSPQQFAAQRDSARAQQIANQVGPGASIRAEFANVSGMRRVVASFHVDADAYVLVGHLDADGILRIAFPVDPRDDGFVRGNRDYRTPEFFAGFTEEYRFRVQQPGFNQAARPIDSYDGQLGYAFIIASWRPLAFDRFQTDGRWDSFELADDRYLNDPRPAIYELASLLAGPNPEAYTVAFARYTTTNPLYAGSGYYGDFGRGLLDYCLGYSPIGYGYSGFVPQSMFIPISSLDASGYPSAFYSRGRYYFYDDLAGCYRTGYPPGAYPGFYGYRIAGTGPTPPVPATMRGFSPRDRSPGVPTDLGTRTLPVTRLGASDGGNQTPISSTYRQRGLITADDPATTPSRRTPTVDGRSQIESHSRPSIQEMVSRRPEAATGVSGRDQSLGRTSADQAQRAHPATSGSPMGVRGETRGYQAPSGEPRSYSPSQGETHTQAPRVQSSPQVESRPVVRDAPVSRPTPPAEMRAPSPPSSPPPASPPPASSSSSQPPAGSRPPGPPSK